MKCWKQLSSGKYIDLLSVSTDDIDINDITQSLDVMPRFNGHHNRRRPLVVTQHSLLVHDLADADGCDDDVLVYSIIHDFPEYLYGDIQTGIKIVMGDTLKGFTNPIDKTVESAVTGGMVFSDECRGIVKKYDLMSLDIERVSMWHSGDDDPEFWPDVKYDASVDEKRAIFDVYSDLDATGIHLKWLLGDLLAKQTISM